MNEKSRISNVLLNSLTGILSHVCKILLSFLVRIVFIQHLAQEYLGVSGLFSNILTILSLAELGVGGAIEYTLYKPVAQRDYRTIASLLSLYRKTYLVIGCAIGGVGLMLIPLLPVLIRDAGSVKDLSVIYTLYLLNTIVSYFSAHKRSIFIADQRERVLSRCKILFAVALSAAQCAILLLTSNFLLYLTVQLLCTIAENVYISIRADREYPFLKEYKGDRLPSDQIKSIVKNVKALMIYKVGSTALDGSDNIILSAFEGLAWVGKLSNYTLIISSVNTLVTQCVTALTASVGNYIAKEPPEHHEGLLRKASLYAFCLFGASSVCLACLSTPFIRLVFGSDYVLSTNAVLVLVLNFYIYGMMSPVWTFRSTMGLFVHGKYRPLASAVINIVVSIWLADLIGPVGVLVGTTITRVSTNVWYDPYIVYKHGLKRSPLGYYLMWGKYLTITAAGTVLSGWIIRELLPAPTSILWLVVHGVTCLLVFAALLVLTCFRTAEFRYLVDKTRSILLRKR